MTTFRANLKGAFRTYLQKAVDQALQDADAGTDGGNLQALCKLCHQGVRKNWMALTPRGFLLEYLWCVGSIQKKYRTHILHYPEQKRLFRQCHACAVVRNEATIRASWGKEKCDLNGRMFEAVMATAADVAKDWDAFKCHYLLLPAKAETEALTDWQEAADALDSLPMVGPALAWYLIRNLYGGPFFKPDLHINAIVDHFFGPGRIEAMSAEVRQIWLEVCSDSRLRRVHLGMADYILWWYRQKTGDPATR